MHMELRKASESEIEIILEIMASARDYQRLLGFKQWVDGYPGIDVIREDINSAHGYVFVNGDTVLGYAALACGDEAYDDLAYRWRSNVPYGVIHRLATAPDARGRGLSSLMFRLMEEYFASCGLAAVKVDTGLPNVVMQHILDKCGYESRGVMLFPWGERIGYEKVL